MSRRRLAGLAPLMKHPRARIATVMTLVGVLGFHLFGNTPAALDTDATVHADWSVAMPASPDLAAAQAVLGSQPLWASQPAPAPATGDTPPPAPPPRLLGVIRVGTAANPGAAQALFLLPDGHRERASAGATLADGTTVESLGDTRATILMADGRKLDLRLLDGPAAPAGP